MQKMHRDVISHSFTEGYKTKSNEEGFGGIYGSNQSLSNEDEDMIVHGNSPGEASSGTMKGGTKYTFKTHHIDVQLAQGEACSDRHEKLFGQFLGFQSLQNSSLTKLKSLLPDYQQVLSSMPSRRLNLSKLSMNCEYFQNKLVDTIHFMEILNLKEKYIFFCKLLNLAEQLLREIVLKKVDEEAAIRTNTTILLENIASHLNEGARKRVLINAFTVRALRDTFPPAPEQNQNRKALKMENKFGVEYDRVLKGQLS